jgi:hypothetical protein
MNANELAQAYTWVALPDWAWMPGMLAQRVRDRYHDPQHAGPRIGRVHRVLRVSEGHVQCENEIFDTSSGDFVPVLSDAATRGCLAEITFNVSGKLRCLAKAMLHNCIASYRERGYEVETWSPHAPLVLEVNREGR